MGAELTIPELGPALGRLVAPPPPVPGTPQHWIRLDDVRVGLVTGLFELLADARRWAREGERELALATVNREAWEILWGKAVQEVAERGAKAVSERLLAAAREVRLPAKRIPALALDQAETRALAARLSHGTPPLFEALTALDQAAGAVRSGRATAGALLGWQEALLTAARRLEAAWLALEETLHAEWRTWDGEIQDLRRWRRPRWPLVVSATLIVAGALYAGLVLGGYLPVPGPLAGPVNALWSRWN